ncbi:hypothetical protein [Gorillibacterium sp. sgz500922]|uniref:hypothetical protein n=1 Tax=Gorillibacterium sp. sgz500922 TaxID=3446694 RepID=UPI003F67D181
MLERTDALALLGLASEAGEDEVESKYLILAKRHKNKDDDEPSYPGGPVFSKVTEAYHSLIGYHKLEAPVYAKLSRREKLRYLIDNYSPEIGFAVCAALLAVMMALGIYWFMNGLR